MARLLSETYQWPSGNRAAVAVTFDVDAESGVLGEAPEAASRLGIMTHQAYGPRAGLPRLLRILERRSLRATFFVPGFTADRHPDAIRAIVGAGHEIGHHGYLHERVTGATREQERSYLRRGLESLDRVAGIRPEGWRAPMWETNYRTPALLADHGFRYDSSLMDSDRPYRLATGPEPDAPTLIEIPIQWALDDGEQYAWLPDIWEAATIESPAKVLEMWSLEFEAILAEGGCMVLTMHPFLSGRPSRAAALDRLLERITGTDGVWFATAGEIARYVETLDLPAVYHAPIGDLEGTP
ncbi:MAG TPA: polysaccharide deacetylase [Actinomycetota bacterium]|nr:polysaccharide deacetylase [Actinomycetota bacterium]